ARLSAALDEFEARKGELDAAEARQARIEAAKSVVTERAAGFDAPQIMKRTETNVDVRSASRGEIRDAALKLVEGEARNLASRQLDHVDSLLNTRNGNTDGGEIAKRLILTENDAYRSAFMKGVTQVNPAYTAEEAQALNEYRAMSSADANGGYGVPVLIDPTIILTSGAADAPILNIARIVTVTTDNWKGVSSAGVSWSYDSEATEVSDDAPTLAQPTIDIYTARGFIPYSIEIGQDYPGFAEEMRRLLDQGYVDLVASQSMTGATPVGIFTALDANTNVEVVVTTDGTFTAVDLLKAWKSLPERYRSRATWIMSTDVENEVRTFSANDTGAYYTVNLTQGGIGNLFGRPVLTSDYAPEFTGTTGAANILVVGDFSNFVVAQRAGMTVELVSHLFGVTNARPTGQRGWFAYARHGFDSVNDSAFRLLQNQ
ncbi:MAG TPA: phage major capsid protein, partial [Acidimicrobiia bacterium]